MNDSDKFYLYLMGELPVEITIGDLEDMCFTLFCTVAILPKKYQSLKITKEVLAGAFARIAEKRNESDNLIRDEADSSVFILEKYWIDMISKKRSIGKMPNIRAMKKLLRSNDLQGNGSD
jgi:hypothetical protein